MDYNQLAVEFITCARENAKTQTWTHFNTYSRGEYKVLFYLYRNSGQAIVPSDIAKYTETSTARIATILNTLEKKGLITREISRKDRRKILVTITDKGQKRSELARDLLVNHIAAIFSKMGQEKSQGLVENFRLFLKIAMKINEEEDKNV